ncbi:putative O-methyltransferase [Aspergillus brunneoviolaceus CBS 621.78]|uniref:O-methyltransferase n=1 Tax=Aspergillus brunneoviolaceus CBS 621.78 TaxID=1450534 RepID=A0ACD1G678_9EURO|nr:putative O-methyltransferase [Aspergillus brunneoviolaceus CBS 621.78]RAH44626.1 putative O-methyltransferase [Aspergillus brunneoviolaceus CBS 621.78]
MPSEPVDDIIKFLDDINPDEVGRGEVDRLRLRAAARRLIARVESPYEQAWGLCFDQPIIFAAIQTCIDVQLWSEWTGAGGGEKSLDELVHLTTPTVGTNLLRRLLRLLAAFDVVEQTAADRYKPTPFSPAIGDETTKIRDSLQAALNLPTYLASIGYREPTSVERSNYAATDPDGLSFFARLRTSPSYFEAFTGHMESWTARKTPWTAVYDTARLLRESPLEEGTAFVVDVGGNTGIDITHAQQKHLDLPAGAFVLQDVRKIIGTAQVDEKTLAMAHNFFLPQPVRGSHIYFMHAVLYDWPDDKAKQILTHTRNAMRKGYSKLLIYDIVLPSTKASIIQATMDVQMMTLLSASERTEADWRRLLTDTGLQICRFWPDPREYEMIIEAEVAEVPGRRGEAHL